MRRMLGRMLEANVWANMERMLGPILVVRATGYTMRQIVQHWKQTLSSRHGRSQRGARGAIAPPRILKKLCFGTRRTIFEF